jgi:hypothetical protein
MAVLIIRGKVHGTDLSDHGSSIDTHATVLLFESGAIL